MMTMMRFDYMLLFISCLILNHSNSLSNKIDRNPFFKRFERLNYNLEKLNEKHSRVQRSIDDHLTLSFESYNRKFRLKLYPKYQNYFDHEFIEIAHDANRVELVPTASLVMYEGEWANEPKESSLVSGSIIDGLFVGVISSTRHGKYFVESLAKYDSNDRENHSIIYHESDVNSDLVDRRNYENRNLTTMTIGCAARHEKVRDEMEKTQTSFQVPKVDLKDDKDNENNLHRLMQRQQELNSNNERSPFYKYTLKANSNNSSTDIHQRVKRQSGNRLLFPDNNARSTCNLYLKIDPTLYTLVFNNEGKRVYKIHF